MSISTPHDVEHIAKAIEAERQAVQAALTVYKSAAVGTSEEMTREAFRDTAAMLYIGLSPAGKARLVRKAVRDAARYTMRVFRTQVAYDDAVLDAIRQRRLEATRHTHGK